MNLTDLIEYQGAMRSYRFVALAENVNDSTLRSRWDSGIRGPELWAPPSVVRSKVSRSDSYLDGERLALRQLQRDQRALRERQRCCVLRREINQIRWHA